MNAPTPLALSARRESGEDRRAAIALAARDLIAEKGFEGLRTRDIAERVGINIATLHYHVPSKEALIALVAESLRIAFAEQSRAHVRDGLTPTQLLELEFDDYAELLGDKHVLISVMTELLEKARRDASIAAAMGPMMGKWKQIVADILEAGRDAGEFRADLDPAPAAQMLVGAMMGFSKSPNATPQNFERLRAELLRAIRNPDRTSKEYQDE
ncbi:MAG: TetR/AcrR family transcriptional regulator [Alphaproteobacteria bacterium]|nr:TetR/AcrR family transcriptional regulator [Alphaproteobacteria bacterium]